MKSKTCHDVRFQTSVALPKHLSKWYGHTFNSVAFWLPSMLGIWTAVFSILAHRHLSPQWPIFQLVWTAEQYLNLPIYDFPFSVWLGGVTLWSPGILKLKGTSNFFPSRSINMIKNIMTWFTVCAKPLKLPKCIISFQCLQKLSLWDRVAQKPFYLKFKPPI